MVSLLGINNLLNDFLSELYPNFIEIELIMDITHFRMDTAIDGFQHFKVVNWVGIRMSWEQPASEAEKN